eukprot:7090395-Prymnesium_polylepis.2
MSRSSSSARTIPRDPACDTARKLSRRHMQAHALAGTRVCPRAVPDRRRLLEAWRCELAR